MELVEVVASDEVDPEVLEAQQLFVALEFPARFGSKVMKHLSSNFQPLTELGFAHLKRLKKHPEAPKMLVALVCPLKSNDLASLAPRTRELFEKHTRCWPLIFHASVEEAAALPPIEKEEKEKMEKHLRTAIQIGKQLKKERQKTLSCAWGCAIVDPELDAQVVASEVHGDMQVKYKYETLYHPVMVAVDGVAERDQRREAEDDEETARKKQKRNLG
ncbi:uncharacterized protein PITG_07316 [Phytophthora infestans T30-4]|uniref:Uncharacterized protein n=1 Tax=Phytophthora infestans (strain T30-4) TaxID=403677 RepID=D0N7T0_PHYIT|nr:uncharacterized protein PITG_07316 [Phytophthora infestans T30-4]EEY53629.1 conserved hypothetical protein [Phytophthora infestans T30-4]|eukprot:XP_002905247.1 conserved hypothetical protein [Phytophthora infestans T30-4]